MATAGDALLSWISAECETRIREREETNASVESMDGDVVRLLARVDAMCDAIPSRRLARALRDLHRARLRLVDARAKARALDSTRDYLRGIVLDARDVGEEASARARRRAGGRAGRVSARARRWRGSSSTAWRWAGCCVVEAKLGAGGGQIRRAGERSDERDARMSRTLSVACAITCTVTITFTDR